MRCYFLKHRQSQCHTTQRRRIGQQRSRRRGRGELRVRGVAQPWKDVEFKGGDHERTNDPTRIHCGVGHNGTASWFIENFRNMLVMETGNSLWLARATPRAWLEQGKRIGVQNAPTYFGTVAYEIVSDVDNGKISGLQWSCRSVRRRGKSCSHSPSSSCSDQDGRCQRP